MEPVEETMEEIMDKPVNEITKEPAEEILEEAVEEITEEPLEEITEKPVKEIAKEPVAEITEALGRKIKLLNDMSSDMTIQYLRNELRSSKFYSRKMYRDRNVNEFRATLGEIPLNYTEKFVKDTVEKLKRKKLDVKDYNALQMALIQSDKHISAFFNVADAVRALGRDLSGRSTQAKLAAANCCCNLSLGNLKACTVLSKSVGPYLIAELESANDPLKEVCAWTIGNLACTSNGFKILHAQGCIKSLINLAQQSSDELLPAASYALSRYIFTGHDSIEETDIIQVGEILSTRYPKVSDNDTMWLLAFISCKNTKNVDFLIKCAPDLCDFLISNSEEEVEDIDKYTAALRIITNLVTEPTGKVASLLFQKEPYENSNFIEDLLANEYFHIRIETLWLIGNLYNHPVKNIREQIKWIVDFLEGAIISTIISYRELNELISKSEIPTIVGEQISLNFPE